MKAYLNIVCKNELKSCVRNEIEIFVCNFDAKISSVDAKAYWKEKECVQFLAEIVFDNYSIEKIKEEIKRIWAKNNDVCYTKTDGYVELAVYASISEVLLKKKVFLTFNFIEPKMSV